MYHGKQGVVQIKTRSASRVGACWQLHATTVLAREAHPCKLARKLDGALVGLGARVAEEGLVGEAVLHQPLGQLHLGQRVVQVGGVRQEGRLLGEGGVPTVVTVAQGVDGDACGKAKSQAAMLMVT